MTRINRYILQQVLILFGFFALVLVLIYWINRAVRLFDQLIANGQSAWVFLEFTALSLPSIISLILPMAAFAAAVYMTNKLSADSELSILQATGHSGPRLMRPFMVFGLIVIGMQAALTHYLVPASLAQLQIRQVETAENATARLLTEGTFVSPITGVTLYIKNITAEGELVELILNDQSADDVSTTYSAKKAFLVRSETGPKLVLIDGVIQQRPNGTDRLNVTRFNDFVIDVGQYLKVGPVAAPGVPDMNSVQLLTHPDRSVFAIRLELAERTLDSLLPFFAVVLGVSTLLAGGFSRFGIWPRIIYAVCLLIVVKLVEGIAVDYIRSAQSDVFLMFTPIVFATLLFTAQILRRDRPWRSAPLLEEPS